MRGKVSDTTRARAGGRRALTWSLTVMVVAVLLSMALPMAAAADGQAVPVPKTSKTPVSGEVYGQGLNDTWYLAEGSTAWGFRTHIQIENPNAADLSGRMTFMLDDGTAPSFDIALAGASLIWVNPIDYVGSRDFSTKVECLDAQPIAVSRVMLLGEHANSCIHSSIGTTAPSQNWFLPEGSTGGDFETFVLVQNPNATAVSVTVVYMTPTAAYVGAVEDLAPFSRKTYNVGAFLPDEWSVATQVYAQQPVIAERAVYWGPGGSRLGGHESIGVTTAETSWYLAEGSTGGDFETWVLVMNPNESNTDVTLDFYTETGYVPGPTVTMGPLERRTFNVAQYVPDTWSVSTLVTGDQVIVAERAMYGNNRAWGHDSVGMTVPHSTIFLPYSQCGVDSVSPEFFWESWTLVQNPQTVPVDIEIWYLTEPGAGQNYFISDTLPAGTRKSYNMANALPGGSWATGVVVDCLSEGMKINAENATYASIEGLRIVGCDTIGGFSDYVIMNPSQ